MVDKLWPDSTVICIATGPSLTRDDVDACRDTGTRVIAINDAYTVAPWADVLYACDGKWWKWHKGVSSFKGLKFGIKAPLPKDVIGLKNLGDFGLSLDPRGVKTGSNSGYQAINLAVLLGASRIVLLGYDMGHAKNKPAHFFGAHRDNSQPPYSLCLKAFATMRDPLKAAGVSVVNCSRQTALDCFPRATLADALLERVA